MNRYLLHIIVSILFVNLAKAQLQPTPKNLPRYDFKKIHFGFTLGINSLDFNIKYNPEVIYQDSLYVLHSNNQKGFNLGIVSNFRLGKYTDFRFVPALVFGERHLIYSFADSLNNIGTEKKKVESTLLDFPIYIKYKSERYNNFRSYILFGLKYSLDIASQKDIIEEDEVIIRLNPNDLMGEIGFGMDFYLEFFKFSPQIKISAGILNLLDKDQSVYTTSIKKLYTNGWMLSFTFE
ncbi:MAG: hypothetical protein CMP66_03740 [Flavobacteriales bacterium]|nr:hypothetical protein [Flavobacteriales bacterium]|tara:strand:- start:3534 stop:4241 length:708 start_codon:yes stop_codon:yes gene_type:complete